MYIDNEWSAVTGAERDGFLNQVDPIDGKYKISEHTEVHWRRLSFYDTVVLIRVRDSSWPKPGLNIYYLTEQGNLYRLNGTSPPIHEVNAKTTIKLNDDNVLDYLKFFCFFVRGEEGPFLIAESMDDPHLPKNVDPKTEAVIAGTVRPASFEGRSEANGYYMCDAVVFYSNALFLANFAIQPSGIIEMLQDEPIAGDLPTKVNVPIS